MATSLDGATLVNPRYYNGPKPKTVNVLPTDAVTFKAGQLGYFDSDGKAEVCATNATHADFIFNETRAAAATATKTKASLIDADTEFEFQVVNGAATAAAAAQTMVGGLYALSVTSNVVSIDLDTAASYTNDVVYVTGLMSDVEPKRNAIADSPGCVIGHIIRTATQD